MKDLGFKMLDHIDISCDECKKCCCSYSTEYRTFMVFNNISSTEICFDDWNDADSDYILPVCGERIKQVVDKLLNMKLTDLLPEVK